MKKLTLENIPRQIRYKLATLDTGEYYLIDGDYPLITIVLPFLAPSVYKKCYVIDEELYQQLRSSGAKSSSVGGLTAGAIFSIALSTRWMVKMSPDEMWYLPNLDSSYALFAIGFLFLTLLRINYIFRKIPVQLDLLPQPTRIKLQSTDRDDFVKQLMILVVMMIMLLSLFAVLVGKTLLYGVHIFFFMTFFVYFYGSNIMFLVRGNYNVLDEK